MRRDDVIYRRIVETRDRERQTACCIRNGKAYDFKWESVLHKYLLNSKLFVTQIIRDVYNLQEMNAL